MEIIVILLIVSVIAIYTNKYMSQWSQAEGEDKEQEQILTAETVSAASYEQTKENQESDQNVNKETKDMEEKKGTRDLFLETLTQIGCQYEVGEGEKLPETHFGEYQLPCYQKNRRRNKLHNGFSAQPLKGEMRCPHFTSLESNVPTDEEERGHAHRFEHVGQR